jgi:hypothetical protein
VSPVKYELGFYIPEDDILHTFKLHHQTVSLNSVLGLMSLLSATGRYTVECYWPQTVIRVL